MERNPTLSVPYPVVATTPSRRISARRGSRTAIAIVARTIGALGVATALAAAGSAGRAGAASPSLVSIGRLHNEGDSHAIGVSPDGSVVAGNSRDLNGFWHPVLWTRQGGLVELPAPPPDPEFPTMRLTARELCDDGTTVVGTVEYFDADDRPSGRQGIRWRQWTSPVLLGDLGGGSSNLVASDAYGCTPDGNVIVGFGVDWTDGAQKAVRWDDGVISVIGTGDVAGGVEEASAFGISADASVIVGSGMADSYPGYGPRRGFRWTQATGIVPFSVGRYPTGVSQSGHVIVGIDQACGPAPCDPVAWRSSRLDGDGGFEYLGQTPGGTYSVPTDVTADGGTIVGSTLGAPFVWTRAKGMRRFADVLAAGGVDTTGWSFKGVSSISQDGSTIVGTGMTPDGHTEGFVAVVPEPGAAAAGLAALLALGALCFRRDDAIR